MNISLNPPAPDGDDAPSSPVAEGITHLLLDIEGTTCPVTFVAEMLFPYASAGLGNFLRNRQHDPLVQPLLEELRQQWRDDSSPEAQALLTTALAAEGDGQLGLAALEAYAQHLIRIDRKLTVLKDLQGLIWDQGYADGSLRAPLFEDVAPALQRWRAQGLQLGVYSSGSVAAQQQLYGHSSGGDLRGLFGFWFDTRIGGKKESDSYLKIAQRMACRPEVILFISDVKAELAAARSAGLATLFSWRPGNPEQDPEAFMAIRDYNDLEVVP